MKLEFSVFHLMSVASHYCAPSRRVHFYLWRQQWDLILVFS